MRVLLAPSQVPSNYPKYWDKIAYPVFGSPKYDGIRATTTPSGEFPVRADVMSRTWKLLPSYQVQEQFCEVSWVDGELIEGNPTDFGVYNRTQSHVMSENKPGNLHYYLFDYVHPEWRRKPFSERLEKLHEVAKELDPDLYTVVEQRVLLSREQVEAFEDESLEAGYEGVMLKSMYAPYKEGRATINEGIIYKLKRFYDDEGEIVGFVERQINNNPQEIDERGYAKRSSAKEGKIGAGMVGKFKVKFRGEIINVAPGNFTHDELTEIWENQEEYIQSLLKFRHFAHGVKDAPRHARAIGFRSRDDV